MTHGSTIMVLGPPLPVLVSISTSITVMFAWLSLCNSLLYVFVVTTDGQLIGPKGDSSWLYVVPWGFNKMLHYVAERYDNPGIYVTENGAYSIVH